MTPNQTAIAIIAKAKLVPDQNVYQAVVDGITEELLKRDEAILLMREALKYECCCMNDDYNAGALILCDAHEALNAVDLILGGKV